MESIKSICSRALLSFAAVFLATDSATAQFAILCDCDDPQEAPCGNGMATALWGGCINSLGTRPLFGWSQGSSNVVNDDMVLTAYPVIPNGFGLLFMGPARVRHPFGDGLLCTGAGHLGLFRFPVQQADSMGLAQMGPGLVARAAANFGPNGQISAGDTWIMQYWYRDVAGPCGSGFNTTNAIGLTFQ